VVYSNEAKSELVGVDPELNRSARAVSTEVARALADRARARFDASVGVGITGIAGPGGGTPEKAGGPRVLLGHLWAAGRRAGSAVADAVSARLPGDRAAVRDRPPPSQCI